LFAFRCLREELGNDNGREAEIDDPNLSCVKDLYLQAMAGQHKWERKREEIILICGRLRLQSTMGEVER
jgi:hypothetical protein